MAPFLNTAIDYVHQLPACTGAGHCRQGDQACRTPDLCRLQPKASSSGDEPDGLGVFRALGFVLLVDIVAIAAIAAYAWIQP